MQILLTEAASPLAYHVASLLASNDTFSGQHIELVLCDHREKLDVVTGVMYELQDCLYPNLKDVSVSHDFLQSIRTADIALVLPIQAIKVQGDKQLEISHSLLTQRNFHRLNGVFHERGIEVQDEVKMKSKGLLSSAVKIVACLNDIYRSAETEEAAVCPYTTLAQYQEEAEFGVPPDVSSWNSYNTDNRLLVMHVTMTDCQAEDKLVKKNNVLEQCMSRL